MKETEVRMGDWLQAGFELYKNNFGLLLLVNLVALVISTITFGVLSGPMMVGIALVTLALLDGREPKPVVGDVFKGFEVFLNSFLYAIIFIILMLVTFLFSLMFRGLSLLVYAVLVTLTIFTIFFIAEQKMDFWPAVVKSYNIVKDQFWPFFGLVLILAVLNAIGSAACCVGLIFTNPFFWCVLAVAYRAHFPPETAGMKDTVEVQPPSPEETQQNSAE